uniref:VWFA domain-containing protein n=1 Tax=Ascaris lumbricoides TaxID=6252 RepID=A0A0M3HFN1_ASCLU
MFQISIKKTVAGGYDQSMLWVTKLIKTTMFSRGDRHLRDVGGALDALQSSAFAFVNSEEFVEYSRPINHKIIFVAGIGVKQPQPLNEASINNIQSHRC